MIVGFLAGDYEFIGCKSRDSLTQDGSSHSLAGSFCVLGDVLQVASNT